MSLPPDPSAVKPSELASFTRQLGAMLDAGVSVLRALRIASQYSGSHRLIEVSTAIGRLLEEGSEFHETLAAYPEIFGPFYQEMARQGDLDGTLGKTLLAIADYLDRTAEAYAPESVAAPAQNPVAAAPPGSPPALHSTAITLLSLGAAAMVVTLTWAFSLMAPNLIDPGWLSPLCLFLVSVCLLSGGWALYSQGRAEGGAVPAAPTTPAPEPPRPPPKPPERIRAETEGVVRNALLEEEEEAEQSAGSAIILAPPPDDPFAPPDFLAGDGEDKGPTSRIQF
jgi:hypothetical protein